MIKMKASVSFLISAFLKIKYKPTKENTEIKLSLKIFEK